MKRRSRRLGWSLVELLVVVAIVAILIGLFMGAAQKALAAYNRVHCGNQLRQLAFAVRAYEVDNGRFPQGTASSTLPEGDDPEPFPGLSWMGAILPQLGEDALWGQTVEAYKTEKWPFQIPPHSPCSTVMKRFCCPGDNRVLQVQYVGSLTVALTSYLGVSGTDLRARDGIFYSRSQIRSDDVLDGLGNTIMIGERPPSTDLYYGWWYSGAGQWDREADSRDLHSGSLDVVLGAAERNIKWPASTAGADCPDGPYTYGPGKLDSVSDQFHFWSLHGGGGNFAFADGSVRIVPYRAASMLPALATRNGRESVTFE